METKNNAALSATALKREDICLDCGEIIRHPMSIQKIKMAFEQWLIPFPKTSKHVMPRVNYFTKKIDQQKPDYNICPHCYSKYLYSLVKEAGAGMKMIAEFLFIFNFEFENKENFYELQAYGGY